MGNFSVVEKCGCRCKNISFAFFFTGDGGIHFGVELIAGDNNLILFAGVFVGFEVNTVFCPPMDMVASSRFQAGLFSLDGLPASKSPLKWRVDSSGSISCSAVSTSPSRPVWVRWESLPSSCVWRRRASQWNHCTRAILGLPAPRMSLVFGCFRRVHYAFPYKFGISWTRHAPV